MKRKREVGFYTLEARVRGVSRGIIIVAIIAGMLIHDSGESWAESPSQMYTYHAGLELPEAGVGVENVLPCAGGMALQFGESRVAFFPENGLRLSWKETVEGRIGKILCAKGQILVFGDVITAFDVVEGKRLWNYPITGQKLLYATSSIAVVSGFDPAYNQLMALSMTSGEPLWRNWSPVQGATKAVIRGGETLEIQQASGSSTLLKLSNGRTVKQLSGLGDYPRVEASTEWNVRPEEGPSWMQEGGDLLIPRNNTTLVVVGTWGEKLLVKEAGGFSLYQKKALASWVEGCSVAIAEGGETRERCGQFLGFKGEFKEARLRLAQTVLSRMRKECASSGSQCGPWLSLLGPSIRVVEEGGGRAKEELALELGLLAIEMTGRGQGRDAIRLMEQVKGLSSYRWKVVEFGISAATARGEWKAGKRAFRRGESVVALEAIEELGTLQEIQGLLPVSYADIADGKRELKTAISDLDAVLPVLRKDGLNQSLCFSRCRVEKDLGARMEADPCEDKCVF